MLGLDNKYFLVAGRVIATQIILLIAIFSFVWGSQKLYSLVDKVVFPTPAPINLTENTTEIEKGVELLDSITYQLRYELDSTFGWTANDIIFNKYILDNRSYRQYGVYNATKTIFDYYSTTIAKLGSNDRENDDLYQSRMNHFALSPSRWGFLFIPSAEGSYKKGLNLIEDYKKDLLNNEAIYNCRPDDIYNAFDLILSDRLLGYAIGLLQNSESTSFTGLDNKIYEVQGMVIVIRDFFNALYVLYPETAGKNNEENYQVAMRYLDAVCSYNPLLVTSVFNSTELVISYLLFARNRIEDIKESIRI